MGRVYVGSASEPPPPPPPGGSLHTGPCTQPVSSGPLTGSAPWGPPRRLAPDTPLPAAQLYEVSSQSSRGDFRGKGWNEGLGSRL